MFYIGEHDKIKVVIGHEQPREIVNNTGFLPLACYSDVFLMSNYKLYRAIGLSLYQIGGDYVVDSNDFTDKFVQINFEFYEIIGTTLRKIVIKPKNCLVIITDQRDCNCYYTDTSNKLLFCRCDKLDSPDVNSLFIDNNVDLILHCTSGATRDPSYVVCSKANKIVCYEILRVPIQLPTSSSNVELIGDTYYIFNINIKPIDYNGATIIRSMYGFLLDSDNNLFVLRQSQIFSMSVGYSRYNFTLVRSTPINFPICDFSICKSGHIYLESDNKIYNINKHIDSGCFKKRISRVKSAHS